MITTMSLKSRIGENQTHENGLLLTGRAVFGRHGLRLVCDLKIAAMWPHDGAPRSRIAVAIVFEGGLIDVFDIEG